MNRTARQDIEQVFSSTADMAGRLRQFPVTVNDIFSIREQLIDTLHLIQTVCRVLLEEVL